MGRTVALVVAAGSGSRAGGERAQAISAGSPARPLLAHAVDHLAPSRHRRRPGGDRRRARKPPIARRSATAPSPPRSSAARRGGSRCATGSRRLRGAAERVLIHDAARPFLPAAVIDRLLDALDDARRRGPGPARRRHAGARRDGSASRSTRDGAGPGADAAGLPLRRHPRAPMRPGRGGEPTDDAQVARAAGLDVALVEGDPALEKLTYEADFARAEARCRADAAHRLRLRRPRLRAPARSCGSAASRSRTTAASRAIATPTSSLHALTDAILGALGAGDIGDHFPPSDPQWRGAASSLFLEHARDLVERRGGRIDHVDVTIICEAPQDRPASGRDARADRRPVAAAARRGLASRRRRPSGSASPAAAKASPPRRSPRVRLPEDRMSETRDYRPARPSWSTRPRAGDRGESRRRAPGRGGGELHRRAGRGGADRDRRQLGRVRGGLRHLFERGQDASCSTSART